MTTTDHCVDAAAPTDEMTSVGKLFAGFGAMCLGVAVLFGVGSALFGDRPRCVGDCDARAVPIALWLIIAVAAGLLALVWRAARGSDRAGYAVSSLGWVAVGVGALYFLSGLPAPRLPRFTAEPVDAAGYALTAVFWLCLIGAATTAIGWRFAGHRMRSHPPGRALTIGAVLGVVAALTLSGMSWWAATDVRYLDATTASEAEIPPVPDTFGQKRFRTPLGIPRDGTDSSQMHLEAAGPGFVVWSEPQNGITAYDSTGQERWHYRRPDANSLRISALRVFDEGRTILLALQSPARDYEDYSLIVGLDATTGRQLWSATGPEMSGALFAGDLNTESPFLVDRGDEKWTAFDTRTGDQRWQIPTPTPCGRPRVGDTASALVAVTQCPTDDAKDEYTFRLVTVEPATGKVLLDKELLTRSGADIDAIVQPAGTRGTLLVTHETQDGASRGARLYVDATTGRVTDFGDATVAALPTPVGDVIVRTNGTSELDGGAGTPLCSLPETFTDWSDLRYAGDRAAWLADPLVIAERYGRHTVQTVDRRTCQVDTVTPVADTQNILALAAAPGTVVLLTATDDEFFVEGYTPN